jgi:hypothetical protein
MLTSSSVPADGAVPELDAPRMPAGARPSGSAGLVLMHLS